MMNFAIVNLALLGTIGILLIIANSAKSRAWEIAENHPNRIDTAILKSWIYALKPYDF